MILAGDIPYVPCMLINTNSSSIIAADPDGTISPRGLERITISFINHIAYLLQIEDDAKGY